MAGSSHAASICCIILLCQMCAILSGVALLYGTVIVINPSSTELKLDFNPVPIMCVTQSTYDILIDIPVGMDKPKCTWKSCGEWCMSKGGPCLQIHTTARHNGSRIKLLGCQAEGALVDEQCSGMDENISRPPELLAPADCNNAQCKRLHGVYNCSKFEELKPNPPMADTKVIKNECRKINPAFTCKNEDTKLHEKPVLCNSGDTCEKILRGIYTCTDGECKAMEKKSTCKSIKVGKDKKLRDAQECDIAQMSDCKRRCTQLDMKNRNVVVFSQERLIATTCKEVESPGDEGDTVAEANQDEDWRQGRKTFFTFCTYVDIVGNETTDIIARDCFNATFGTPDRIEDLGDYRDLLNVHQELAEEADNDTGKWIIPPESVLTKFNLTQLRINPEGCVNSLIDECKAFFETHAHDGFDGYTQDRYPCYYTDKTNEYVIGKFNPEVTAMYLLLASCIPGVLFIVACTCLFVCSKSVGINKEGEMQVTLLRSEEDPPPVPAPGMEEL